MGNIETFVIKHSFKKGGIYHLDFINDLPFECTEYFEKHPKDDDISDQEKCLKSFTIEIKIKVKQ